MRSLGRWKLKSETNTVTHYRGVRRWACGTALSASPKIRRGGPSRGIWPRHRVFFCKFVVCSSQVRYYARVVAFAASSPLFPRERISMSAERKHRAEIVCYGRMLHERGFVAAMDGNLSVRLDEDKILVTPTGVSKGAMRAGDMVIVDLEGTRVAGRRNVTSEIGMHLLIYRTRPEIQAIVHAHPPTATGFAAAGMALTEPLVCEVVMGLGCIPLARYGTPGTSELAQTL